jgi:glycolate oxidase iron-sulfur subunit
VSGCHDFHPRSTDKFACQAPGSCAGSTGISVDASLLSACIHCGLCLPACPTYLVTGHETESPRGRIELLNLVSQGRLKASGRLIEHIENCLGCLGCQSECPSGVQYERIINQAHQAIAASRPGSSGWLLRLAAARVLPDYGLLRTIGALLRVYQTSGLSSCLRSYPILEKLTGPLWQAQELLPPVPKFEPLPRQSWMSGPKESQVLLFAGCVMNVFYNHVNHAAIRLLTAQRQIVSVPEQTCCGALAFHAGETDIACGLAKKNIEFFEQTNGEIVVTASGCAAMLKGYGELFAHDDVWRDRAVTFAGRVRDLSEYVSRHGFARPPVPVNMRVAYHAACHLAHAQKTGSACRDLLATVPGLEVLPLEEAEHCCGSAGIFNLTHPIMSASVLARKIDHLVNSGADAVVTTNPGCLLQLAAGLRKQGLAMRVMHLAELLDQAYQI